MLYGVIAFPLKTARRDFLPGHRGRVGRSRAAIPNGIREKRLSLRRCVSGLLDPLIQNVANSQSLNPYSYVGNNPLSGTDPTGYATCQASEQASTSACAAYGAHTIVGEDGKETTLIVGDKGDHISVSGSGGTVSGTFTGQAGVISNALSGGRPLSAGSIEGATNGAIGQVTATYGLGPDQQPGHVQSTGWSDPQAQIAQKQGMQFPEHEEGLTDPSDDLLKIFLPPVGVASTAVDTYNEVQQNGLTTATLATVAVTAVASKVPGGSQLHHIATNKSIKSGFTAAFKKIFQRGGMDLENAANKVMLEGHAGRHAVEYHQYILRRLQEATDGLEGDEAQGALRTTLDELKQELLNNPNMVKGAGLP